MGVRIRFEPGGEAVIVAAGERLVDVVDEYPGCGVPLSCRSAHCAVCRVQVEQGACALEPAGPDERDTLSDHAAGPGTRLCCQLRVVADVGEVVLRRVED